MDRRRSVDGFRAPHIYDTSGFASPESGTTRHPVILAPIADKVDKNIHTASSSRDALSAMGEALVAVVSHFHTPVYSPINPSSISHRPL